MNEDFNIWREESMHRKILKQFDTPKSQGGYKNDGYEEFPKMLYKAQPHPIGGRLYVALREDELSLDRTRVVVDAQQFNRSCQMEVKDPSQEERAMRDGWRRTLAEALEFAKEIEPLRQATEAAHRNYEDRNMSERAKAEAEAIEKTVPHHVAEIPEQPKKRKPMSEEAKAKLRDTLAKAREVKAAKKKAVEAT